MARQGVLATLAALFLCLENPIQTESRT